MDNGSLETLQGQEVCWTGQVYHLFLACGDPAAFAVKWCKNNLIIHLIFLWEKKRVQAQSCFAGPGRVSESDGSVPGHAPTASARPFGSPAPRLPHPHEPGENGAQPLSTQRSVHRDTPSALHPGIRQCPQPDKKYSAGVKLRSWELGDGLVCFAAPVWKDRDGPKLCPSFSYYSSVHRQGAKDKENHEASPDVIFILSLFNWAWLEPHLSHLNLNSLKMIHLLFKEKDVHHL